MSLGLQGEITRRSVEGEGSEAYRDTSCLQHHSLTENTVWKQNVPQQREGHAVTLGGGGAWVRGFWGDARAASTCIPHNSPGCSDTSTGAVPAEKFYGGSQQLEESQLFSAINVCVPVIAYNSKLFSWMCQFLIWITKSKFYVLASEFIGLLEELKYFIFISKQLDSHWTTGFHYWCSFSCLYCWRNAAILHQSVLNSVPRSPSGAHALQREFSWALREGA